MGAVLAGAAHPAVPRPLPLHLLLLPRRLLQGVLGRSRPRARSASRVRRTGVSSRFRWCSRTSTATSCGSRSLFLFLLSYDVWLALWFTDEATGATGFGIGLGTILLAVNVVLLSCYTLGCHVMRHMRAARMTRCRSTRSAIAPTRVRRR